MRKLPLGRQDFSTIRENNYLYVDKTKFIYNMIKSGDINFLARPRRFGKSLLVNTLKELFEGNKSLFKGLYIYDKWDWSEKYAVVKLDLLDAETSSTEELKSSLEYMINEIASDNDITLDVQKIPKLMFKNLIKQLYEKTSKKVVILVDEYDNPLTDNVEKKEVFNENRDFMQQFYKILKSADEYIRFIFLTGVSRFSKLSVFSTLNNPRDITLSTDFANICGYTHEELESNFKEYIDLLGKNKSLTYQETLEKINFWYDGYSWDGENKLYNPFSTLSAFIEKDFEEYWFRTGTTNFLMKKLKEKNNLLPIITPTNYDEKALLNFGIDDENIVSLLFQTGYLTIQSIKEVDERKEYSLFFPNHEVKIAFGDYLLEAYTNTSNEPRDLRKKIFNEIQNLDNTGLNESFEILLSNIPYQLHIPQESYYHSLFLAWLFAHGFEIKGELNLSDGRIDGVLKLKDSVIICEFKHSFDKEKDNKKIPAKPLEKLLDDAIDQIHAKKYYKPYQNYDHVILMGVAISNKEIATRLELLS